MEILPVEGKGGAGLAQALGVDDRLHPAHVFSNAGAEDEVLEMGPLRDFLAGHTEALFRFGR